MKKLSCVVISAAMLLLLYGCGGPKTETKYILTETEYEFAPDQIHKTVYHFDENWQETGQTEYINGELNAETTISIDENGDQVLTIVSGGITNTVRNAATLNEDGTVAKVEMYQNDQLYSATEFDYDEQGNRVYQCQTNAMVGMVNEIWFTADGKMLSTKNTSPDGSVSGADYSYNEDGLQTGYVNYYTADGQPAQTHVAMEYNSEGKEIRETTTEYDADGNVTRSYYNETTYEGNQAFSKSYDEYGQVSLEVVTTYDDAGNITLQESGSPGSGNVVRMRYTWVAVEVPVE